MGMFSDHKKAICHGSVIEVETSLIFGNAAAGWVKFRLVIDNKTVTEERGYLGRYFLRGFIQNKQKSGIANQVVIQIDQGLFRTTYRLTVDGSEHPFVK